MKPVFKANSSIALCNKQKSPILSSNMVHLLFNNSVGLLNCWYFVSESLSAASAYPAEHLQFIKSTHSSVSVFSSRWWNMHPTLQLELRTWLWNFRCLRGCLFYVLWVVGRGTWRPLIMGQVLSVSPENRTFFPVQQQLLFSVFSANL